MRKLMKFAAAALAATATVMTGTAAFAGETMTAREVLEKSAEAHMNEKSASVDVETVLNAAINMKTEDGDAKLDLNGQARANVKYDMNDSMKMAMDVGVKSSMAG